MHLRAAPFAIGLVLLLGGAIGCRNQPVRDARIVENPSVVTVVGWSGTKGGGATGFFVAPDRVVTCRHVVEAKPEVFVRLADSRQIRVRGLLAESVEHDLVLLEVDPVPGVPPLALAERGPRAGETLTCVGSPDWRAQTVRAARVVREETEEPGFGLVFQVRGDLPSAATGALGPGASGAPLFDENGRVSGVLTGMAAYGDDLFIVPARFVAALVPGPLQSMTDWGVRTAADPAYRARKGYDEAGQDYWRKDYAKALRKCEALLPSVAAIPRTRESVCEMIGRSLVALGRPDDAVARLLTIASEHPSEPWGLVCLGQLYARLGRHEDALAQFLAAIRLDPGRVPAHANAAICYAVLGQDAAATRELDAVRSLDPKAAAALAKRLEATASAPER